MEENSRDKVSYDVHEDFYLFVKQVGYYHLDLPLAIESEGDTRNNQKLNYFRCENNIILKL